MLWKLAWRNLWRNRTRTVILVFSMAVGFWAILFFTAWSRGAVNQVIQNMIRSGLGHLQVHARGFVKDPDIHRVVPVPSRVLDLLARPEVAAVAPRIRLQGVLSSPTNYAPVQAVGGLPEREARMTRFPDDLVRGRWPASERDILVGTELADLLDVKVGDKVVLTSADRSGDLTAYAFRVAGIFRSPVRDINRYFVLIHLRAAAQLVGYRDEVNEIAVLLRDQRDLPRVLAELRSRLDPNLEALGWDEIQPLLRYQLEVFDEMNMIFMFVIFLAAGAGIMNVFYMAIYERMRELGLLRALGVTPGVLRGLLVREALLLVAISVVVGTALTVPLYRLWQVHGLNLAVFRQSLEIWGTGAVIYPALAMRDVGLTLAVLVVCVALAIFPPLRKAVRIAPVEALRHV